MSWKKYCVCMHCGEIFMDDFWLFGEPCPESSCDGSAADRRLFDWLDNAQEYSDYIKHGKVPDRYCPEDLP